MASKALNICLAIIRWAPVLFITAVVVWSYYAYVVQMCLFTVENIPEKVFYLLIYHPLLFMFSWAYWQTIFAPVASIPKEFFLSKTDVERFEREENEDNQKEMLARLARNLPVQCRTASGAIRYCEKCKCVKPDRAHHCSVCGQCVLKMDHHCPWVNNCVCFRSYKFFVLFLGYALIYCIFVAATSIQYFIRFWTKVGQSSSSNMANLHVVFVFFASIMFAISVLILVSYHLYLVTQNRSTLESFRAPIFRSGPDKDGFSLGRRGNFIEVFGDEKSRWFLPLFTSQGDGVNFPTRVVAPPTSPSYHSMDNTTTTSTTTATTTTGVNAITTSTSSSAANHATAGAAQPSYGDGVTYPIRTVDEDYDSLLGQRQRWMEEGENDSGGPGFENEALTNRM